MDEQDLVDELKVALDSADSPTSFSVMRNLVKHYGYSQESFKRVQDTWDLEAHDLSGYGYDE